MSKTTTYVTIVALMGALVVGVAAYASGKKAGFESGAAKGPNPRPAPRFDATRFTTHIDNAWYPLKPGIVYVYRGTEDGDRLRDVFWITSRVTTIEGVRCRIIKDKVFVNGVLQERTTDYYSQDAEGNVWYFGEDTAELDEQGNVTNTDGTWRSGRDGAEPGLFMEANPQVGHHFQQEYLRGEAEDHYRVVTLSAEVDVPYGHFGNNKLRRRVQITKEWSPLEPEVRDHKYYVRGIGQVKEQTVRGGNEALSLVKILKH
jgi:hypothetical protein